MTQPCLNVADYLLKDKDPDRTALQFLSGDISYGEPESATAAVANYLLNTGAIKR